MPVLDLHPDSIIIDPDRPARRVPPTAEEELALRISVTRHGVLQPLIARQIGNQVVLVKGGRRLAAAREAGLPEIPVRIYAESDPIPDAALRAASHVRAALHPVEKWHDLQAMLAGGLSLEQAAETIGVSLRSARRLQLLASIIPELLGAMVQHSMPQERDLAVIAAAPVEMQQAAWKKHGKSVGRVHWGWSDLAAACRVQRIPRGDARFDDAAAARHGIAWEEDLFASADTDSRSTTNVKAFRAAQQEWIDSQVEALKARGYQAEILQPDQHGYAISPKGTETVYGKEDKAPKTVIRGYWMDPTGRVRVELYKRPKAAEKPAAKGKGDAAAAEPEAPAPKPPRGISKKGLTRIAEAKEVAVWAHLAEARTWTAEKPEDIAQDAETLLHALLVALAAGNVSITAGRYQRVNMTPIAGRLITAEGQPMKAGLPLLLNLARETLALMLHAPRPEQVNSGRAFDWVARILDAEPPRVDTEEILQEVPKPVLVSLAKQHGVKPDGGLKELARKLAGNATRWQPIEAQYVAPGIEPDELDDAEEHNGAVAEDLDDAA